MVTYIFLIIILCIISWFFIGGVCAFIWIKSSKYKYPGELEFLVVAGPFAIGILLTALTLSILKFITKQE